MIISSKFVQEGYDTIDVFDPCVQFEQALVEATIAYENEKREIERRIEAKKLQAFVMESVEDFDTYMEAEEKNIFAKLGRLVMTLVQKFTEMCDNVIQKIKDSLFRTKNAEKKLNELAKQHPELTKEKIRDIAAEGGLNFNDMKSLAELDQEFYKLMKLAEDSKVDPKSFKGRCKEFEAKLKNNDTTLQKAAVVAGAATTVITLGTAIRKYKVESARVGKDVQEARNSERKINKELYKKLKDEIDSSNKTKSDKEKLDVDKMGKFETLVRLNNLRVNKKNAAISKNMGALHSIYMWAVRGVDKVAGSGAGKSVFGDVAARQKDELENPVTTKSATPRPRP